MKTARWNTRLVAVVVAGSLFLPQVAGALQCVEYGYVSLVGTLVRQTYAGPPDFESVTKGDAPEVIWILQLEERTCVYSQSREAREYEQHEIQLELKSEQSPAYQKFLGKRLIIDGELIRGGARHEKRLVLVVRGLREATALHDRNNSYDADCRCYTRL